MPSPPNYVFISSAERNSGDSVYDFRLFANNILFWQGYKYELQDIYLANTQYTFDSSNNKIYFAENTGLALNTATITPGTYDSSTLPAQIKTQMDAASIATGNTRTYTITYSASTLKFTVTGSAGTFKFMFGSNTSNSAAQRLGWSTYNIAGADDTLAAAITSPYLIDLAYPLCLSITIDGINTDISSGKKDYFAQVIVPFDVPVGTIMRYQPPSPPCVVCNTNVQSLHVRVSDPFSNKEVQIQQDFSMVFKRVQKYIKND